MLHLKRRAMVHRLPPGLEDIVPGWADGTRRMQELSESDADSAELSTQEGRPGASFQDRPNAGCAFFSQRLLVFTQEDEAPDRERSVPQQNSERGDCDNYVDVADGGELAEDGDPDGEEDTSVGAAVVHLGIPEAENLDESSPLRDRVFNALVGMCGACR